MNEKKATKFLKFIKHSQYNIANQLSKQSTKISTLSLLFNLKVHQTALLKVLNNMPPDISVGKLDHLVNNIITNN